MRKLIDDSRCPIRLEVDGGVNVDNIGDIGLAGADTFVAGSAIFNQSNYKKAISELRKKLDTNS